MATLPIVLSGRLSQAFRDFLVCLRRGEIFWLQTRPGSVEITIPKYLKDSRLMENPSAQDSSSLSPRRGTRTDFVLFTLSPVADPKVSRILRILGPDLWGSDRYKRMSSAYSEIRSSPPPEISQPESWASALIQYARGSMAMAKSRGDRGQPCLVPLRIGNGSDRQPLTLTYALVSPYRVRTHLLKWGPKRNFSSKLSK